MDLSILVGELEENLLSYRLQNIYNVANSTRQLVLKFSIPDSKRSLVIDCGNKLHLTKFERPIVPAPSNFVTKLRKHLKTRRLTLLKQVGNDRIVVLQFSDGMFYLVFEFFSAGNILLLDADMKILSLHRLVTDLGPDNARYAVNETYGAFDPSLFDESEPQETREYLAKDVKLWISAHKEKLLDTNPDKKKKKVFSIHKLAFVNASHLSSDLILRTFEDAGINPSQSCLDFEGDDEGIEKLVKALAQTEDNYRELLDHASTGKAEGYIVEKKNALHNPEDKDSLEYVYEEFHPFKPYKANTDIYRFEVVKGYNQTIDQFFSTIESTKYALRVEQQKLHAEKRLSNAKNERDKQIQLLQTQQEIQEKKGNTISYHADLVEQCKLYVQEMISKQMDWTDIENIIKFDGSRGKSEASYIKLPLNLIENKIKLQLPDIDAILEEDAEFDSSLSDESSDSDDSSDSDSDLDSDEDSSDDSEVDLDFELDSESKVKSKQKKQKKQKKQVPTLTVDIDLTLTAFANARNYFDSKKSAVTKQTKVEKSTNMALKNAEKRIQKDLAKSLKNETDALKAIRPKYWFEKYFWFVSSDGYLCLAGRDDSQIDMIYYRHFSDNDFFVSSDMEGSLQVFILNPYQSESVPPSTLFQAGIFAMLASNAWNGKVSSSAWWLNGVDVTKKEFDGSLLGPGRLNLKDKKNYMPPAQLVMGFGFYFLCDEETTANYTQSRVSKQDEHGLKVSIHNKKQDLENMTLTVKDLPVDNEPQEIGEQVSETTEASQVSDSHEQLSQSKSASPEAEASEISDTVESALEGVSISESSSEVSKLLKAPTKRGRKGKMKKINAKYADQDEEERRLRMEVLGTLKQVEDLERKKKEEVLRQAEQQKEKFANRSGHKQKVAEERELQRYLLKEEDEDYSGVNYLELLDSLVTKPAKSDNVSAVVPVFAPWSSLNKFKYKVKIQPGLGKKGKSLGDALNYFATRKVDNSRDDLDVDWPEEHEIIKQARPNDLIGVFTVSKLKLVLPGGNSSDAKGNKKNGKKGGRR